MAYGTLSLSDLLAVQRNTIVADVGLDKIWDGVSGFLKAHNDIMTDMLDRFTEPTQANLDFFGGDAALVAVEVDEYGTSDTQKLGTGTNVGFPLYKYNVALGWTNDWFTQHTMGELDAQINGAMSADYLKIEQYIKRGIFKPTNNTSYVDRYYKKVTLPLRAFVNADSQPIPPGQSGTTFNGATHTHYLATASLVAGDVTALISTVLEHYTSGAVILEIPQSLETAVRALTGFTAYYDPRVRVADTVTYGDKPLDVLSMYNRAIGIFGAAEVWVRPYIPANYMFAYVQGQPKPLARRLHPVNPNLSNFRVVSQIPSYPMFAEIMERYIGFSVKERTNGAVLYIGGGSYVDPGF